MKLGIVIDSSAGITQKEAQQRGWHYLPLYLSIDGKEYADGVDLAPDEYFKKLNVNMETRTSATPPGLIEVLMEDIKDKYDFIIVYGLSQGLSSQTNNLMTFTKKYNNVYVVPSEGIGYAIVKDLECIEELAKDGTSKEDLIKQVNYMTKEQVGVVVPKSMGWLVKGGRISPKAAAMANMLKIVPMIIFKDGKLDKYGKGRTFNKTIKKASVLLKGDLKDIEGRFILYSAGIENAEAIANSIAEAIGQDKVEIYNFPPVVVNHVGPGAGCIFYSTKKVI